MTLTGAPLFAVMAVATVLGPVALMIWLHRRRTSAKNWLRTLAQFGLVLGCQLLAATGRHDKDIEIAAWIYL